MVWWKACRVFSRHSQSPELQRAAETNGYPNRPKMPSVSQAVISAGNFMLYSRLRLRTLKLARVPTASVHCHCACALTVLVLN